MKLISWLALTPGSGAMTITVNLCAELAAANKSVFCLGFGEHGHLRSWLQPESLERVDGFTVADSRFGFSWTLMPETVGSEALSNFLHAHAEQYEYVFSFGWPETPEAQADWLRTADWLGLCVNLKAEDVLPETAAALHCLCDLGSREVDLLIPNQVNPLDWEHNAEVLLGLSEQVGSEKMAAMIPFCERIHDLPATGSTVWELSQANLQIPFRQLLQYLPLDQQA